MYRRVIYWFKRDLRIEDNRALFHALSKSREIIPVFVFIPSLIEKFNARDSRLGFIIECLRNLAREIASKKGKLYTFYDEPVRIFDYLITKYKPAAIFTARGFSYDGEATEKKVRELCTERGIDFISVKDNFLSDFERIPYRKVFSNFYRLWKENLDLTISPAISYMNVPVLDEPHIDEIISKLSYEVNNYWKPSQCLERLNRFDFGHYGETRDRLDLDGTSKLSPFIRFGTISIRQIYQKALSMAGEDNQFIKELAWREFWYHIKINFPHMNTLEFQEKRRALTWENNDYLIRAFKEAKTGYPVIDASIRQLIEEKWMHNRARMIVASFFTKDLLSDWRIGERFFMEHLLDYDDVVNIGNWQWNASVGPDPRPLRIFNPIIQAKKFDPQARFIKKYIPELRDIPAFMLQDPLRYKIPYHRPVVDHFERLRLVRKVYLFNNFN